MIEISSLRIYTNSYGSPGDTEYKIISSPATLKEWIEKSKISKESEAGFLKCITKAPVGSESTSEVLVNLEQVEWVYQE
jgi:hypothetical protein